MQIQLVSSSQGSKPLSWFDQGCDSIIKCLNSKVARVFFSALAGAILALSLSMLAALSLPMGILAVSSAAAVGGCIPLLVGWACSPKTVVYKELEQVAKAYEASPRMLQAVNKIRQFLAPPQLRLGQSYDYHHFHHELTVITEQVKVRDDLKGIWGTFLNRIEGRSIAEPDGFLIPLTVAMETERLANRQIEVITDRLNPQSPLFEQELSELMLINHECTAGNTRTDAAQFRQYVQDPNVQVHLARQRDTQKILGYVAVREEINLDQQPTLHVTNVARRAEACSLGVAQRIFQQIFAQPMDRYASIFLEVRKGNQDAIALYNRWGFARVGERNNYYNYPAEDALIMQRQAVIA